MVSELFATEGSHDCLGNLIRAAAVGRDRLTERGIAHQCQASGNMGYAPVVRAFGDWPTDDSSAKDLPCGCKAEAPKVVFDHAKRRGELIEVVTAPNGQRHHKGAPV